MPNSFLMEVRMLSVISMTTSSSLERNVLLHAEALNASLSVNFVERIGRSVNVDHNAGQRVNGSQDFRISGRFLADIELQALSNHPSSKALHHLGRRSLVNGMCLSTKAPTVGLSVRIVMNRYGFGFNTVTTALRIGLHF
jgi:hypothetical protein